MTPLTNVNNLDKERYKAKYSNNIVTVALERALQKMSDD
jgi:hypothetical protein